MPEKPMPALHFYSDDCPFFWARASSTQTHTARAASMTMTTSFREAYPGGNTIPVFNRFCISDYHRKIREICLKTGMPYLVDVDDLFWELPGFSTDEVKKDNSYREYVEELCAKAWGLVASTEYLRERLAEKFPGKRTFLVGNSPPAWYAPKGSVIIANTDSFKMSPENAKWFINVLMKIWERGVGLQLIGENDAITSSWLEPYVHSLPRLEYGDYLRHLHVAGYRLGLIPVDQSPYANAKSAIKALEFANCGMPSIVSDTTPHRDLLKRNPGIPVTIVDNNEAAWTDAIESVLDSIPQEEVEFGRKINTLLHAERCRQSEQWREVFQSLPADIDLEKGSRAIAKYSRRNYLNSVMLKYLAPFGVLLNYIKPCRDEKR